MLVTKILFVLVIVSGMLNILGWEISNHKKLSYIIMWTICMLQILTRLLEAR